MAFRALHETLNVWACLRCGSSPAGFCRIAGAVFEQAVSPKEDFGRRPLAAITGFSFKNGCLQPHAGTGRASSLLLLSGGLTNQVRCVARVKVHRFAGVVPLKIRSPKSEWYIQAEKEFLSEREEAPVGYIERWREEDLAKLDPPVRQALSLHCASNSQIHKWRKLQLCRQLQRRPFDTGSSAVQIACLTENILNARQHLLRHRRDHTKKRILSIWLARRHKAMKYLYRTDYDLYKLTCKLLRIKCVQFAIPDSRDRQRAISPVAVDGDRCKFLIRQRLWKGRYRPRPVKQADGKTVRYTRHVMEQPPPGWNMPHETKARISRAWPYGVKEERLHGEYTIPNPTAAGIGYCPVPLFF